MARRGSFPESIDGFAFPMAFLLATVVVLFLPLPTLSLPFPQLWHCSFDYFFYVVAISADSLSHSIYLSTNRLIYLSTNRLIPLFMYNFPMDQSVQPKSKPLFDVYVHAS